MNFKLKDNMLPVIAVGASLIALFAGNQIVNAAKKYIGKEETANNSGFKDKEFEAEMKAVGWQKGNSWCVYFAKLVWKKSLQNETVRELAMKLITGSSVYTLQNFTNDKSGHFTVSNKATKGALVVYQNYKDGKAQSSGHVGVVTAVYPDYFETIEGNTNDAGGREGYIVAAKKRKYTASTVTNGLRLKKFITVKTVS